MDKDNQNPFGNLSYKEIKENSFSNEEDNTQNKSELDEIKEERTSEPLPLHKRQLSIKIPSPHQLDTGNNKNEISPPQVRTPVENLLINFDNCTMFEPTQKLKNQHHTMSLTSFPSTNTDNVQTSEIKEDEMINSDEIIKTYYPTTLCSALFLRVLRFIRMICIILPIASMVGSLFTHTNYVDFIIDLTAKLWAKLVASVKPNSATADTLGGLTIGIITALFAMFILRFLWDRLVRRKFLTASKCGLKNVKSDVQDCLDRANNLTTQLKRATVIENKADSKLSNAILVENSPKTVQDCYVLFFKCLTLMQHYNVDRMGPYDIAKERIANQYKTLAIFLFLVPGIDKERDLKNNKFRGKEINYDKIYHILLGTLIYAQKSAKNSHERSKWFSCLKKKCTKSHYALMLERLVNSELKETYRNDENTKNQLQNEHSHFIKTVTAFHSTIWRAEAKSGYAKNYMPLTDSNKLRHDQSIKVDLS